MKLTKALLIPTITFFSTSLALGHCVWQLYTKDARGNNYYLDIESILQKENGTIEVNTKRTLPEKNDKYKMFLEKVEIDCSAKAYRTLEKKLHRKDDVIENEPVKDITKPITKDTPIDYLREAVCR